MDILDVLDRLMTLDRGYLGGTRHCCCGMDQTLFHVFRDTYYTPDKCGSLDHTVAGVGERYREAAVL